MPLVTTGAAVPDAIGATGGPPQRPAIAFGGDGAVSMNTMAEPITIASTGLGEMIARLVVAVHNDDLNQVIRELRAMGHSPQFLPFSPWPTSIPRPSPVA